MANEESQLPKSIEAMPDLLSELLGQWTETAEDLVTPASGTSEPVMLLNVDMMLDGRDRAEIKDDVEVVAEPVADLAAVAEDEPVSLLNIDALLDAWDDEKQEIVIETARESVASLAPVVEREPVQLFHVDTMLDGWGEQEIDAVVETVSEPVANLSAVLECEPESLLNIDALLDAWDDEKQEIVIEIARESVAGLDVVIEQQQVPLLHVNTKPDSWDDQEMESVVQTVSEPVANLAPVVENEPVSLLNIDALLDAWDDEKQEIVIEAAGESVASFAPVIEQDQVPLLNIDALLDAWDDEKQVIDVEPEPERELVTLARAIEEDALPAKEDRATDVEAKYRYITFWMADEAYALPIAQVIESDKLAEVTPLPRVNEAIRGLIHLRGEILPVLDLRLILGSKSNEVAERMLIVRTKNSSGACGLAVDRVTGLIAIQPNEVEQCVGSEDKFVSSFCDRHGNRIRLLDLDRIFEGLSNPLAVRECNV